MTHLVRGRASVGRIGARIVVGVKVRVRVSLRVSSQLPKGSVGVTHLVRVRVKIRVSSQLRRAL